MRRGQGANDFDTVHHRGFLWTGGAQARVMRATRCRRRACLDRTTHLAQVRRRTAFACGKGPPGIHPRAPPGSESTERGPRGG
jgi:hypothetical protein